MRKIGSDLKYVPYIFAGLALSFPFVIRLPLALPFIIGSGLIFWGAKRIYLYKSLKNWEKTEGTLIQTDIGVYEEMDKGIIKYYHPLAYFSYIWEGSKNKSNIYSLDKKIIWSVDLEVVTKELTRLEALKQLTVYVNPQAPDEAVLNIEISKNSYSHAYAVLISGILICLLGIVLVIKI